MKKLLTFLLLSFLLMSGGNPHTQPVNDLWFTYQIQPTNYWPIPNSAPIYTNEWYEEIQLPYLDPSVGTLRGIEFYIVQNTEFQVRFENLDTNITGWPTTWDRINHRVKFYINEGPFLGRLLGVNSFSEGGYAYTVWCPFDGSIDGAGCSGWSSPKTLNSHHSRDSFTLAPALDWINGSRKPGFTVRVAGHTRFLFQSPEGFWAMQLLDRTSVSLKVRYLLE